MATVRIQVRRGTTSQWSTTNPVLAAGEMGVETNTNLFKFGNGTSTWTALSYANNSDVAIGEISQDAINDALSLGAGLTKSYNDGTNTIEITVDSDVIALKSYVDEREVSIHNQADSTYIPQEDRGAVNGVASLNAQGKVPTTEIDVTVISTREYAEYLQTQDLFALDAHKNNTTNAHGIPDISLLATDADVLDALNTAKSYTDTKKQTIDNSINSLSTNLYSYADTKKTEAITAAEAYGDSIGQTAASFATGEVSAHNSDTSSVHGIADTLLLATKSYADSAASSAQTAAITEAGSSLSTHASDTTNVHGIADTSALALTATVNSALNLKAPLSSPTFTGTVAGITKTMVGLGSVDNTADSAKPVSTATQTALDLKAPLASPALTGVPTAPTATAGTATTQVATTQFVGTAVSNLVASAPAALDTLNELATALGNDANFSTTLTNNLAAKAPLASPAFTGTATVVNLTASGTVTLPAAGIVFSDGTQALEGVPSRTLIIQKSASYTLSLLTERDDLIEVSSASAATITIPADSTLNYPIGTSIDVLQTSTGQVTIAGASGVTVNSTPGLKLRTTWSSATLFKRAANTWVVFGDLTA